MSSIITPERRLYPFKMAQVREPAHKLMLVDEDQGTLDDSRWAPQYGNLIATRHSGRGVVALADGHAELVKPAYGIDPAHNQPTY